MILPDILFNENVRQMAYFCRKNVRQSIFCRQFSILPELCSTTFAVRMSDKAYFVDKYMLCRNFAGPMSGKKCVLPELLPARICYLPDICPTKAYFVHRFVFLSHILFNKIHLSTNICFVEHLPEVFVGGWVSCIATP